MRSAYNTRPKELILQCLREHAGGHITAEVLRAHLLERGLQVGLTTVYRHLDRLVSEGTVIKYAGMGSASASYQYIGDMEAHRQHYHLVCLCCGHMVHLDCSIIDEFTAHIKEDHAFDLDSMKTVFYGYCKACRENMEI